MEEIQVQSENIQGTQKKGKLNSEKIRKIEKKIGKKTEKIQKKSKLNSDKVWKM